MYGVPKNLNLSPFHGAMLIQIGIGESQVQFHFNSRGSISVEGHWELLKNGGEIVDRAVAHISRDAYRLHPLLSQKVVTSEIRPPDWFALIFENDLVLRIFNDSQEYESFSIQPGDSFI